MNSLFFIVYLILALILYNNITLINEYKIFFIRVGSVLLITATVLCIKYFYNICLNLRPALKGLKDGHKLILAIVLLLVLLFVYSNQETCILKIKTQLDKINLSNYNPFVTNYFEKMPAEPMEELVSEIITNKTKEIEKNIVKYVNIERKARDRVELKLNDKLSYIARSHSLDMAENNYFSHINLLGEDATDRAIKIGFNVKKRIGIGVYSEGIYENIGKIKPGSNLDVGYVSDDADSIAKAQVKVWMLSMEHRQNILNPQISDIGVGVVDNKGEYISTQVFW
jgi:uncharacterized protein YkwD